LTFRRNESPARYGFAGCQVAMTRRTLLKLLGLLPLVGPSLAQAVVKAGAKIRRVYAPYLPASFPKWDRAVDGLESAGNWVMEFERSWLPSNIVFPRAGQIWEAVCDCEVPFRASIDFHPAFNKAFVVPADPMSFMKLAFGVAKLRTGEKIRVLDADGPRPVQVHFVPVRYQELHEDIVPEATRNYPGYSGYVLHLKTAKTVVEFNTDRQTYFTEAFQLVKDKSQMAQV
jgi:hypothetical protein